MPTVLRVDGFVVHIFENDHPPAHVHVYSAGGSCRVELGTGTVTRAVGLKPRVAIRAAHVVQANGELLNRKWEEIHGGK
jgi:hypothetical protein